MTRSAATAKRVGLIVAPRLDVHAFAVRHAAEELGRSVIVLDTAEFTREFNLAANWDDDSPSGQLLLKCGECLDMSAISGLWWRRPRNPEVSQTFNNAFAEVAVQESREALFGSLNALVGRVFNNVGNSRAANQKAVQLTVAREVGLVTPSTLITNDPARAREFYECHSGKIIYKIFRGPEIGFFPTRTVTADDVRELDSLQGCPCIFQEYIEGEFDLRITVVGNEVYAARIEYDKANEIIDTRVTSTACSSFELPSSVTDKILRLMRRFGLVYGAVDMRLSPSRGFVFFELNPDGQYLWTEIEAKLPISRAIAAYLTDENIL